MLFSKKPKKSKEEIEKEREAKIAKTASDLKIQLVTLAKKKESIFQKVMVARQKGLTEQERQARGLLKQAMMAEKRADAMLMTLELATESKDMAELNMNFLESIGALSEDIIASSKNTKDSKAKKIEDKYMRAIYESELQRERVGKLLEIGDYAGVMNSETDEYSDLDKEIDGMIEQTMPSAQYVINKQRI